MVRAAASGVIDYTRADPKDINWRLRHQLLLQEMQRKETCQYLEATQRDWLAYLAFYKLTDESHEKMRAGAAETLDRLTHEIFPWLTPAKPEAGQDKISNTDEGLIQRYKAWREQLQAKPEEAKHG